MEEYRDASGRLTVAFESMNASDYPDVVDALEKHFLLEPRTERVQGLDEMFQQFKRGNIELKLEWDIWSGFSVTAVSADAEHFIRRVASFVKEWLRKR